MAQSHGTALGDHDIRDIQRRIDDQKARLRRKIVQGSPTQADEDLLGELCTTLRQMQQHRRAMPAGRSR